MYAYRTPGAYFEWLDVSEPRPAILRTDIAGFVGIAERGPLHTAVRLKSWNQFTSVFGGHISIGYLAYAIEGFFSNGGRTCWVVRAANPEEAKAGTLDLLDDDGEKAFRLTAKSPGAWSGQLIVAVLRTSETRFTLVIRHLSGGQEVWSDLSANPQDAAYAKKIINHSDTGSKWVVYEDESEQVPFTHKPPDAKAVNLHHGSARLSNGNDGLESLEPKHFSGDDGEHCMGLSCIEAVDEISVVAIPDIMPKLHTLPSYKPLPLPDCSDLQSPPTIPPPPPAEPGYPPTFDSVQIEVLQKALINHCEKLKDRVAILDTHPDELIPEAAITRRRAYTSSFAALYFPWISMPDPLRLSGLLRNVPPSGHIAGIYARGDLETGVHKPPANQEIAQAKAVTAAVDEVQHGVLNDAHVNVIRAYAGRGFRVGGARTLNTDPDYKYINVRRLLIMIAEVIDEKSQAFVFEPNNPELWRQIEQLITALLDQLWRSGMLDGATAGEAYSVRCDMETNPPQEQDLGRVICEIGLLLPWPAEFVVVRIGFTESGVDLLNGGQ